MLAAVVHPVELNRSALVPAATPLPRLIVDEVRRASLVLEFNVASFPAAPAKSKVRICADPEKAKRQAATEERTAFRSVVSFIIFIRVLVPPRGDGDGGFSLGAHKVRFTP